MKKLWLLLVVIVLGGCKMNNDNNSEDDGLYDYEFTTSIKNESGHSYNFYYGTDLKSKDFITIECYSTYEFTRIIKVKDNEKGVPCIEEDTAPDCILESLSHDDSEYRIIKFNYKNIKEIVIGNRGAIQITPILF